MLTIVKQHPLIDQEKMAVAFLDLEHSSVREATIVEALNLDHMWEQKDGMVPHTFSNRSEITGPFSHLNSPFKSPLPEYRFMLRLRGACVMVRNRNGVLPFLRGLHIQQQVTRDTGFADIRAREQYGQLDNGPNDTPVIQQLYRDWGVDIVWWP